MSHNDGRSVEDTRTFSTSKMNYSADSSKFAEAIQATGGHTYNIEFSINVWWKKCVQICE